MRLAAFLCLGAIAFGQGTTGQPGTPGYRAPRTTDGQPDLQGIWQARGTASYDLEDHGASLGVLAGSGVVVDPADGRIPYQPAALKIRQENAKKRSTADPLGKCFLPGVPRVMYIPFPFQLFQTADFVIVASEFSHSLRTIHLKGKHPDEIEFWMGDSRGRWEGDALVVDVANHNADTWFDQAGNFHSEALHVVERFTRTAADVLMYEATIEDPKVFSKPWKMRMPLDRYKDRKQLLEYECHVYLEEESK